LMDFSGLFIEINEYYYLYLWSIANFKRCIIIFSNDEADSFRYFDGTFSSLFVVIYGSFD
jgi:hypothetical protein